MFIRRAFVFSTREHLANRFELLLGEVIRRLLEGLFQEGCSTRILGRFEGRIINTHPALLPSFPGMHGPRDALAYGVKITGATVFLVDSGVDSGVILDQRAVSVTDDDTVETLHERIKVVERELLVAITHQLATRTWRVADRKVLWT